MGNDQLIRAAEAARRLHVHVRTLDSWVAREILPAPIRVGPGRYKHWPTEIIEALAASEPEHAP